MSARKVLLVEGVDDEHVFKAIFGWHQIAHLDEIRQCGGYESLLEALPVRLIESDVEVLGVVVDADLDATARWDAVRQRLEQAGYQNVPSVPPNEGLVLVAPMEALLPRFGLWIMPNNQLPGILENFLELLVPDGDELFAYARKCVQEIPGERLFSEPKIPKANIHTWLAWQAEPGRPLGQSITRNVLKADSESCNMVVQWINHLYFPI